MIKLISFTICPFVQRIQALLEAANVEYETQFISLSDKPDWFLKISPNGQVPVLITEIGTALFESDAIADYVFETYLSDQIIDGETKAHQKAWAILASKNYLTQCSTMSAKDQLRFQEKRDELYKAFAKAEKALREKQIEITPAPNLLNAAWLVLLYRAEIIERHVGVDMLEDFPKLKNWQAVLLEQNWAIKSVADGFEEAFTQFYLNEERYLRHRATVHSLPQQQAKSCCA